jgi:hypothetical protein
VRAEPSVERPLEDAERKQRRDWTAIDPDRRGRRIILYRLVIVRQAGAQPAFEECRQIRQSRDGLRRTSGKRSAERFRMPWYLVRIGRLLRARSVGACVPGRGWRAERRRGAQQPQGDRAASPHQHNPTGDGGTHENRNCRVESAPLSHSARADATGMTVCPIKSSSVEGSALSVFVGIEIAPATRTPRPEASCVSECFACPRKRASMAYVWISMS